MTKPKLMYFDAPVSRGEECRIALHVAGVDFEDVRVKAPEWPGLKPTTPFGHMPVFELPGKPPLGESNAILVYIGRCWGLHPKDDFEAARHESMLEHVEELRHAIGPSQRMADPAERQRAREHIASTTLPAWAQHAERQIGDGPFLGGATLQVADIKLFMVVRWLASGALDHVPGTIIAGYPKLMRLHDAVRDDARVQAWHAKRA